MPRKKTDDVQRRPGRNGWYYYDYAGTGNLRLLPGTEALLDDEVSRHEARIYLAEFRRRESLGLSREPVHAEAPPVTAPAGSRDKLSITELFEIAEGRIRQDGAKSTATGYARYWKRIGEWLQQQDPPIVWPSQVTRSLVEKFTTELQEHIRRRYAIRNFDGVVAVNRNLTAWRYTWRLMTNPQDPRLYQFEPGELNLDLLFPLLDEPTRESRPVGLTATQLQSIIDVEEDAFFKNLWIVARGSGKRDNELRHLARQDVLSPTRGTYVLKVTGKPLGFCRCHSPPEFNKGWEPKRHHKRDIPVSKQTHEAAILLIEKYEPHLRNPNKKRIWDRLQLACARAQVPAISLHDFRYNWASHLYASGKVSLEQVSRWLGHRDVRTTEIYLRIIDPRLLPADDLPF